MPNIWAVPPETAIRLAAIDVPASSCADGSRDGGKVDGVVSLCGKRHVLQFRIHGDQLALEVGGGEGPGQDPPRTVEGPGAQA